MMEPAEISFLLGDKYCYTTPSHVCFFDTDNGWAIRLEDRKKISKENRNAYISWVVTDKYPQEDIFKICVLMSNIFIEKNRDISLVANSFLKNAKNIECISFYNDYSKEEIEYLFELSRSSSKEFKILIYCSRDWFYLPQIGKDLFGYKGSFMLCYYGDNLYKL